MQDVTLKKQILSKFNEDTSTDIDVMDVNVANHLTSSNEWLKTITEEEPEEVKGPAPTGAAKRRHQITYLAYQAKERELALKKEWAAAKHTKTQTRAKYGF